MLITCIILLLIQVNDIDKNLYLKEEIQAIDIHKKKVYYKFSGVMAVPMPAWKQF
jgi:hypothetical protein